VRLVHAVVLHMAWHSSQADVVKIEVAVKLLTPKLNPVMVIDLPPLFAPLMRSTRDTTGPSNVNV